jgi:cytosine/adenosine deaminase-related metal-dependent hydrolase
MQWRKLKADRIFDGRTFLRDSVIILDESGTVADLLPEAEAGGEVQAYRGWLMPGMVNCHCHLELSHLRGLIPQGTGLADFVYRVVTERHHEEAFILQAIREGEAEMWRNGIVAVGDICNTSHTLSQKEKGRLHYYNFIEVSGWLPEVAPTRFAHALQLAAAFRQALPHTAISLVPHAPYSVSASLWKLLDGQFEGKTITIHNQETAAEDHFFRDGSGGLVQLYARLQLSNDHHQPTGRSSLQSYYRQLQTAGRILLVHNTFTAMEDLRFLQNVHAGVRAPFLCFCVNANAYIENRFPPVEAVRDAGFPIVLGTDSLASNHSLSLLDEIRTIRQALPHLDLAEPFRWATLNGAEALGLEKELGSLERGKTPGVVLVSEDLQQCERLY